jgi:hypothetical protein
MLYFFLLKGFNFLLLPIILLCYSKSFFPLKCLFIALGFDFRLKYLTAADVWLKMNNIFFDQKLQTLYFMDRACWDGLDQIPIIRKFNLL